MEPLNQKSIERVVSHRAMQIGSSFSCQICVVGFLCGICITSFFLAALTSFGTFEFRGVSFSAVRMGISTWNSSSGFIKVVTTGDCISDPKQTEIRLNTRKMSTLKSIKQSINERESLLYSAWSTFLNEPENGISDFLRKVGLSTFNVPKAPHLENCTLRAQVNERLDNRGENESLPPWTFWKGLLNSFPLSTNDEKIRKFRRQAISRGARPPWITGSDEENYPLTSKVQRDLWIHQHPLNCRDTNVKFLVADWEKLPGFGVGAQIAGMAGVFAIAINEKRILVTNYYNRADHDGCKGSSRSRWSCYFFPETSQECRDRAFELMGTEEALEKGVVTTKYNYSSKQIWIGKTPRNWGTPWCYLQPTTDINGSLFANHRKMDQRWWRAQAVRYLMRFQSEYTCGLMNVARHAAFGREAAKMVIESLDGDWPEEFVKDGRSEMEEYVWSNHKPWIPRPLLSMHVRMGDKACEMRVVKFEEYMRLANRFRNHFPQLNTIWLSTEMQEVIDKTRVYPQWKFYYTNVTRQVGNMTMSTYEAKLGRKTSTNYPFVNFLMATEADYFVGALGSTWCFLIDGMRNTGGKVMAGYLSVNKDRFW